MASPENLEKIVEKHSQIYGLGSEREYFEQPTNRAEYPYRTIPEVMRAAASRYAERAALVYRDGKEEKIIRYEHLDELATAFADSLIRAGAEKGTRVAMILDNSPHWMIANLGIQYAGCVDVPRGSDAPQNILKSILEHSGAEIALIPSLDYIQKLPDQGNNLRMIVVMDPEFRGSSGNITSYIDLLERGLSSIKKNGRQLVDKRISEISGDDLASILYSSGTTGVPKGAMLTHSNYMNNLANIPRGFHADENDRLLTILPIWHAYERQANYAILSIGGSIYYGSINTLLLDLKVANHTIITAVPDILVTLYKAAVNKIERANPNEKAIAKFLLGAAVEYDRARRIIRNEQPIFKEEDVPLPIEKVAAAAKMALLKPLHALALKKIYQPIRNRLGDKLRAIISGAGPLPSEIDEFFSAGRPTLPQISEGYGMTETIVVDCVRDLDHYKIFTVGPPLSGIELKIVDENWKEIPPGREGRLIIKGPNVMKGYYKNEELTRSSFRDGYFITGDLAMKTIDGYVKIVGRADDTIVLRNGEKLEPAILENELTRNPLIDRAVIVEDGGRIKAHVFLNREAIEEFARQHSINYSTPEEISRSRTLQKEIKEFCSGVSEKFQKHEVIDDVILHPDQISSECLSETRKIKRKKFIEVYKEEDEK